MEATPLTPHETCSCAIPSTVTALKVREQIELRLLAKLEEAIDNSPPTSFFLRSKLGAFIWGCFTTFTMNIVWILLTKMVDIFKCSKAAQKICNYMGLKGLSNPDVDIPEAAMALESPGVRETTVGDSTKQKEEMRFRQMVKNWLKPLFGMRRKGDTLPVTDCDALSTANSQASPGNRIYQGTTSPLTTSTLSPDTTNLTIPIHMHLPNKTVKAEDTEDFQKEAAKHLPPHAKGLTVEGGSTFFSATVQIAASAMDDLLQCAVCLLKMGCRLDNACTVQVGNSAVLYKTTTGENVEKKLLEEGTHAIPFITSARKHQDRTIVVKGSYLEDIDIKATTTTYGTSMHLHVIYHEKLENGLEVLLAQLPKDQHIHEQSMVHATKTIQMEGCLDPVVLRGNSKEIDNVQQKFSIFGTLCTTRFWICFLIHCIYQATRLWPLQWLLVVEALTRTIIFLSSYFLVEYIISPWFLKTIIHWIAMKTARKLLYSISTPNYHPKKKFSSNENLNPPHLGRDDFKIDMNNAMKRRLEELMDEDSVDLFDIFRHRNGEDSDDDISTIMRNIDPKVQNFEEPVNNPDWEWPCYERVLRGGKWVIEPTTAKACEEEETAKWPFEVITTVDPDDGSESVELIIRSPRLIEVLKQCGSKTGIQFVQGSRIKPEKIFLQREALERYVAEKSDQIAGSATDSSGRINEVQTCVWYVKHLLRFIERHFRDALVQYKRMKAEGCVSYGMLWAFFVPGEGVRRLCLVTNQECFAVVKHPVTYVEGGPDKAALLTLNVMDFNIQSFHRCTMRYKIAAFDGEVPFASLQVCPLQVFSNRIKDMEAHFISMGRTFYQVAMQQPFSFLQFKGSMNFYQDEGGCWRLRKHNADGRVMIDLLSFARMNPDYPLGNAEPPCEVMTGMWTREEQMKKPSDEELMLAPAFAYGFSFRLKKWGCFELCGLREINFNEHAFGALRLKNENQKEILWSVVQQYTVSRGGSRVQNEQSIDHIGSKGTGCIVLCHGPPGTGKTLTAEAMAETLRCPLWSISAFELGEEPDKVETTLSQIMEIAHIWGAILLLDEADAYLERRNEGVDVKRNLLTGVFLRVLEYYRGIMFLTTNRVTAFDDAILSRTTLAISYPALDDAQRREIWKNLLNRAGIHYDATYDDALLQVAGDLNGRQIRNIVHLAQLLAHGRKQTLTIGHVRDAMEAFKTGTNDLPVHLLPTASS